MKKSTKTVYECEYCGSQYSTDKEAQDCENKCRERKELLHKQADNGEIVYGITVSVDEDFDGSFSFSVFTDIVQANEARVLKKKIEAESDEEYFQADTEVTLTKNSYVVKDDIPKAIDAIKTKLKDLIKKRLEEECTRLNSAIKLIDEDLEKDINGSIKESEEDWDV